MVAGIVLGAAVGALWAPAARVFGAGGATSAWRAGSSGALFDLATRAPDGAPEGTRSGAVALAAALLAYEHGGGAGEARQAMALLRGSAGTPGSPEGLYAVALLAHRARDPQGGGAASGTEPAELAELEKGLDAALAGRAADDEPPFVALARALRLADRGRLAEAVATVQPVALVPAALPQAQVMLARLTWERGDLDDAQSAVDRARRLAPGAGPAQLVGLAVAAARSAQRSEPTTSAPGTPAEKRKAERTPAVAASEAERARAALDAVAGRDRALVAALLAALAAARGDAGVAQDLRADALAHAEASSVVLDALSVLCLLEGDLAAAEEVLSKMGADDPRQAVNRARLAALRALDDEELRRRAQGTRAIDAGGLAFPFGRFDWAPLSGFPLRAALDPALVPEPALLTAAAAEVGPALDARLKKVVALHRAELLLGRGDVSGARAAVAAALQDAPTDADALLLDARVRVRQGDRAAARQAIDAALSARPDDIGVLVRAARLYYDAEYFPQAKRTTAKIRGLGYKSPGALVVEAMLEARDKDEKSARAALEEAKAIGAPAAELLRATILVEREGASLEPVRAAADQLLSIDDLRSLDPVVRAWLAEAALRRGDSVRAEAAVDELLSARPTLADAHFVRGVILGTMGRPSEASAALAKALALLPGVALVAEAEKRKAELDAPPPNPRLLPRKKRR
jgi:tetratricopeptide (TPR) repeat protein